MRCKKSEMISYTGRKNTSVDRRLCSTCENYKGKLKCKVLGKIKNPNEIDCSWWKEKINENKIKNL